MFRALYQLWKRKQVSVETKIAIYRAAVLPVLLYGAEVGIVCQGEHEIRGISQKMFEGDVRNYEEGSLEERTSVGGDRDVRCW